jgi:hypothetical protein
VACLRSLGNVGITHHNPTDFLASCRVGALSASPTFSEPLSNTPLQVLASASRTPHYYHTTSYGASLCDRRTHYNSLIQCSPESRSWAHLHCHPTLVCCPRISQLATVRSIAVDDTTIARAKQSPKTSKFPRLHSTPRFGNWSATRSAGHSSTHFHKKTVFDYPRGLCFAKAILQSLSLGRIGPRSAPAQRSIDRHQRVFGAAVIQKHPCLCPPLRARIHYPHTLPCFLALWPSTASRC